MEYGDARLLAQPPSTVRARAGSHGVPRPCQARARCASGPGRDQTGLGSDPAAAAVLGWSSAPAIRSALLSGSHGPVPHERGRLGATRAAPFRGNSFSASRRLSASRVVVFSAVASCRRGWLVHLPASCCLEACPPLQGDAKKLLSSANSHARAEDALKVWALGHGGRSCLNPKLVSGLLWLGPRVCRTVATSCPRQLTRQITSSSPPSAASPHW